jgi:EAL and modified HD-GYP domain-containing signal transduction protein
LARQAIFDRRLDVYGYEILYRTGTGDSVPTVGNREGAEVLATTLTTIGLDNLVGHKRAFVNLDTEHLLAGYVTALPPERVVIEILETVEPTERVIQALDDARLMGYSIALDDFVYSEQKTPFLELAHYVKLDVLGKRPSEIAADLRKVQQYGVSVLAERVESRKIFQTCRELGFELFQGFFHCRPEFISARIQGANRPVILHLIGKLCDAEVKVREIEELVAQDSGLAYRILRYVRSAFIAAPPNLKSLREAISYLGYNTVRAIALLVLAGTNDGGDLAAFETGLIRAKMCARLATTAGVQEAGPYFLTGLLSVLPVLIRRPLKELVANLPVADDIREALIGKGNDLRDALRCAIAWERGMWDTARYRSLSTEQIRDCYLEVLVESKEWRFAEPSAA